MADLIAFHRGSDNLPKPTTLNLFDKDSLIATEQTSEKSTLSRNEDSRSLADGAGDGESLPIFKTSISKSTQKVISMSSISRLSTSRSYKSNSDPLADLTEVKTSTLLYDTTERTNRLAQPRSRVTEVEVSRKISKSIAPKSMPRIIKLACPNVTHDSALISKPISYVSPSALKAIATQRIIELSQPRKDRRFKLPRRKTQIHQSCNLRIRGLSKSKQMDHSRVKAKLLNSPAEDKLDVTKLLQESLRLTSDVDCDASRRRRRSKRKNVLRTPEEMRKRQPSPCRLSDTNSNRSVVIVGLDWEKSVARDLRRSRRCKSSKITKGTR